MENIIFITHHLAGTGGVQKFIALLATKFLEDGHHVTVIGLSVPKGIVYEAPSMTHANYREICLYERDVFTTYPHKLFYDAYISHQSAHLIQEIVNEQQTPIIIVANPLAYFVLKDVDLTGAKKVIGQMHNSAAFLFESKGMFRLYLYFIKKYYKNLDKVLFLTEADAKEARKVLGWSMIDHVPNPLPFKVSQADRSALTNKKIVLLGRLIPIKQVDQAIAIFAQIVRLYPEWTFDIYGDGVLKESLQKQIDEAGLNGSITLKGFSAAVTHIFQDASITILTSKKEGLPMSLMESMAYGVPVIAYNCSPGVEELIDGQGKLIPLNDLITFVTVLSEVIANTKLRKNLGDKSYRYIQQYDVDVIVQKWYQFFEERN